MKAPRLWIVVPIYNDTESFLQLREGLASVLRPQRLSQVRFVVVDDSAGTDPEIHRLRSLEDVTVITPPFNLGHQRAIVYGLRSLAPGMLDQDLVVTMDGDGEDRPGDLPSLLARLEEAPVSARSVVLARRTSRNVGVAFRVLYFFFSILFRVLTGILVRTGNFAVCRGRLVRHVLGHPHFDRCYSSSLISLNLDVRLVPCPRGTRYAGHSRMGYLRLVRHGIAMLMPHRDRIAVRLLAGLAFALSLTAVAASAIALSSLWMGAALPAWAVFATLALLALSLVALGILFAVDAQGQSAALRGLEGLEAPSTPDGGFAIGATPEG